MDSDTPYWSGTSRAIGWATIQERIDRDGAYETMLLLRDMQAHGQSIVLNWGEDDNQWECSWITGGERYTAFGENEGVAVFKAHKVVMDKLTKEKAMSVRAKFRVGGISLEAYGGYKDEPKVVARRIKMNGVWKGNDPTSEDSIFGSATPQADLSMLVVNPEAADQFELEGEYYVTFEKVKDGLPVKVTG